MTNLRLKPPPPDEPLEATEQEWLMQEAYRHKARLPLVWECLFAIPNGGYRREREAAAMQRQGVKPGVPDLCLPVARYPYHGLYIELKRVKSGRLTGNQREWAAMLEDQGYRVAMCRGHKAAWVEIEAYMALPEWPRCRPEWPRCPSVNNP